MTLPNRNLSANALRSVLWHSSAIQCEASSELKIAQAWVIRWSRRAAVPMKFAFGFFDGQIVDARVTARIQTVLVVFPVLVSVGSEPVARIVVEFVSEAHGDAIVCKGP